MRVEVDTGASATRRSGGVTKKAWLQQLSGESTLRVALSFGCSMQRGAQEVERCVGRCVERVAAPEPEVSEAEAGAAR